jgi:hypothetical protein
MMLNQKKSTYRRKPQNTIFCNFSAVGKNDGDSSKCRSVGELETAQACRSDERMKGEANAWIKCRFIFTKETQNMPIDLNQ